MLSSALCLLALFHASPAHGVFPSEHCSSHAAVLRFHSRSPLVVGRMCHPYASVCAKDAIFHTVLAQTPRLQGFAPHESPPLLSMFYVNKKRVALLGFFPPGCSPSPELLSSHQASPHEIANLLETTKLVPFRVSITDKIGWSPKRLPTLLRFLAF